MNEFHYFPSAVYREEKPEWIDHVLKNVERYYKHQHQIDKDNNSNWPVTQTQNLINDPELFFLSDYFEKTSTDLLRQQGYLIDSFKFYTSSMWGQEIGCNGMHEPHVHANTQMCGLLFLETPENGSFPIFSDPRPGKVMSDFFVTDQEVRVGTPKIYFNNMIPGTFMFFNAWLPHQFSINQAKTSTKFIHFALGFKE